MQRKEGLEKVEIIFKTINEFKLTAYRRPFWLGVHQCYGQKISTRDRRSVQGTEWDQCKGQKISARDKCSTLRTFHGVIHELLTSILHAQLAADLYMSVDLSLDKKMWKIRTGPPGHRAIAGHRAVGRWAFRPPGRGPAFSKTPGLPHGSSEGWSS